MPEKHFYFSLGAVLGTLAARWLCGAQERLEKSNAIIRWLYSHNRNWFLFFPVVILAFGVWGIIPDIIHALGILPKEVTRGALFDVFFFHSTFERIENQNPVLDRWFNWVGEIALVLIALGVMGFYVRAARRAVEDYDHRVGRSTQERTASSTLNVEDD